MTSSREASASGERDDESLWTIIRPRVLLIWLNGIAATALFAVVIWWVLYYFWSALQWILVALAVAGFLSLVAFVGAYLERLEARARRR